MLVGCGIPIARIVSIGSGRRLEILLGEGGRGGGGLINDTDVDNHVVAKVFVPRDQSIALVILEADALGASPTGVEAIEVLDRRDNGVGRVMGENLHPHGKARTILRRVKEQQLKCDILGRRWLSGRDAAVVGGGAGHGGSGVNGRHGSHGARMCGIVIDRYQAMKG